jgi:hypothetical protein
MAANCCDRPRAMPGFCGVIVMLTNCAGVIVSEAVPETLPESAAMVIEPTATLVAKPLVGAALLIVATVPSEELQCTEAVRSCVLPSV